MRKRNSTIRSVLAFAGLALVVGCSSAPKKVPPDYSEIRTRVKTVAIASFGSEIPRLSGVEVAAALEARAAKRLETAGISVVGSAVWEEVWRRYADDVGGVYDEKTGKRDDERWKTVEEAATRAMVEEHGVDALLYVSVRVAENLGVMRFAQACGSQVDVYWPGNWRARRPEEQAATRVRSACLVGVLEDVAGKQLLARQAPLGGFETYAEQTRAVRPSAELLADADVLDGAIEVVLAPFEPLATEPPAAASPEAAPTEPGWTGAAPPESAR